MQAESEEFGCGWEIFSSVVKVERKIQVMGENEKMRKIGLVSNKIE